MNILITGASGFIGGALAQHLLQTGHRVTLLLRKAHPALEAQGAQIILGDLADTAAINRATAGQEAIMHVASTTAMWGPWDFFYQTNVVGTHNLLDAAAQASVRYFIYTSSPSVTFKPKNIFNADERLAYTRSNWSFYAKSKALAEQAVLSRNGAKGLRTLALRPHLVWGPGDTHLIPSLIARARNNRLIQVGSDAVETDMTYIDNVVEGHIAALEALQSRNVSGRAYFLTQNEPVQLWPWARNFLARAGLPGVRWHMAYPTAWALGASLEYVHRSLGITKPPLITRFIAAQLAYSHSYSSNAAMNDLGYRPRVTMAEGLERLLQL
ncbi:MAG TPA: NAD-dependent epimerase/dehydratase family protein [Opitutales bacterium]|nr:NAD-dependent epimerase/dehydratase family protein [Opitutales bacterium]